jgi:hypothetical protein
MPGELRMAQDLFPGDFFFDSELGMVPFRAVSRLSAVRGDQPSGNEATIQRQTASCMDFYHTP